jgi:hypothetical protein
LQPESYALIDLVARTHIPGEDFVIHLGLDYGE